MNKVNLPIDSDTDLIARFVAGEKKAFDTLFNRYIHKLFLFTKRYSLNEEEAKELVMDVMLRLWQKGENALEVRSLESYLVNSVKNAIIDNHRRKSLTFTPLSEVKGELECYSKTDSGIFQRELQACIQEGIQQLSPSRRVIFELRREHDLTPKEIAEKLNISTKTVENQLTRAIAFMKCHIRENTDLTVPTTLLFGLLFI